MTEQETIDTPSENAPISVAEDKPTKKTKAPKKTIAANAKKLTKKGSALTDDEKRLARNAALREWRKKNADRVKAYMSDWRAKRKGMEAEPATGEVLSTATSKGADAPTKKTTSKKSKKSKKAGRV